VVDARGERLVVPFHDPSVDASPHWLPLHMLGEGAGPQMLLCDVRWLEGAEAALRAAHAANVPSMLDGDTAAPGVLDRLVPLATHLVFSDAGLLSFTGAADVHAGLRDLARRRVTTAGPHQPVLLHLGASCGADGYRWLQPTAGPSPGCWADATLQHVPAPVVAAVDTLAAGDVFHGALALALLEGRDTADAARWACAAASLKCTRFGGRLGCPSRAELDAHVLATREEGSYPG
jgi:sulfofructose kinase